MDNTKPQRKSTRLKYFDYSTTGAYFITICTRDRMKILSEITRENLILTNTTNDLQSVGEALAPPESRSIGCDSTATNPHQDTPCAVGEALAPPVKRSIKCDPTALNSHQDTPRAVGEALAPPVSKLSPIGEIVEEQMSDLEERYKNILIDEYVIMPDHIHMILIIKKAGGASTSPTMNDIIRTFKSLTSRICKQRFGIENLFQRSFYDHVIRNRKDYETRKKYILENPIKWYYYQIYEDE